MWADPKPTRQFCFGQISVLKHGRSSKDLATVQATVEAALYQSDLIYRRMRALNLNLPDVVLCPERRERKRPLLEQAKSLPELIRQAFARELEAAIETEPLMVRGAVLMLDGGLRTAEAAAITWDDLQFEAAYAVAYIGGQERNGVRNSLLKTQSAYRMVVLSFWGSQMLQRCQDQLSDASENIGTAETSAQKLSAWIRKKLQVCGCNSEFFRAAEELQMQRPDYGGDGIPISDVSAYVLRRDCATRWRNICGLDPTVVDIMLGHQNRTPKKQRVDLRLSETQASAAKALERYIYTPKISENPACSPVALTHGVDLDMVPYIETVLNNSGNEPIQVKLDFEALEPGQIVAVQISGNACKKLEIRHILDSLEKRQGCIIVGGNNHEASGGNGN